MSLILILGHAAVLLAPSQQVIPVGPRADPVQSDRVKTLKVNGQLPQELDWYASIGYRIVEVRGDVLRLERSSNSGDHHDYLVLLRDKKSRTEPRMNDAASRGFRFVPRALFVYYDLGLWRENLSIGVVMEKVEPAGSSSRLQYQLVSGDWSLGTIEKQIIRAAKDGYRLVGIKEAVDETSDDSDSVNMAVLEATRTSRGESSCDCRHDEPVLRARNKTETIRD